MRGKWLFRAMTGGKSGCRKEEENRRQKQSKSMAKPVEHELWPQGVWAPVTRDKNELGNTSQQDVNKAAEAFINEFRKELQLERTLSDRRYYGYLERAA